MSSASASGSATLTPRPINHETSIYDLRFTIWKKSAKPSSQSVNLRAPAIGNRQSSIINHQSKEGVALIITLILLGVVTFMAIAFLALSKRERGAVTTVTDTATARYAADAALANAEAQVVANAIATTNPYNFGLLVSTNFINPNGFDPDNNNPFGNVNYDHQISGSRLSENQFLTLLTNLWYSPRPPVFIPTNSIGSNDFRFYLDLNRNAKFDANGLLPVNSPDPLNPYFYYNPLNSSDPKNGQTMPSILPGLTLSNLMVGDPEWIGVLQRPDQPYGPNNPFVARYAFIALPVGNTLDLNAIHNYAKRLDANMQPLNDSFYRNEGVGSWEINLAAFLADLNTNEWFYNYAINLGTGLPDLGVANSGTAFDDALSVLHYRYGTDYINNLASVDTLFSPTGPGHYAFRNDNIDGYSDGPLQFGFQLPGDTTIPVNDDPSKPWAGADNTNHFFTHQELFDPNKAAVGVAPAQILLNNDFPGRLLAAGATNSTYDRYTYYRLLSQLGTDSTPESGRMNLNYDNLNPYLNGVLDTNNGVAASTNFIPWTNALAFFTNAADRLLRAYTAEWRAGNPTNFAAEFYSVTDFSPMVSNPSLWANYPAFGIGHIPVLVSNRFVYSSAVNRLLQLAANMYDATTTNFYPSVFRPIFTNDGVNVFIVGYEPITTVPLGASDPQLILPIDVTSLPIGLSTSIIPHPSVYGVPWIIGAKKGCPNFNKFSMQDVVQISRKLQIFKNAISGVLGPTNQMYIFSISNSIGINCWNSYSNWYPNNVQIVVRDNLSMMLTNDVVGVPAVVLPTYPLPYQINTNFTWPSWQGAGWTTNCLMTTGGNSFVVPINTTIQFMPSNIYYSGTTPPGVKGFYPGGDNLGWETNKTDFTLPTFVLWTTNRLQVFMLDSNHVIDYVQFAGPNSSRNLNAEFQSDNMSINKYEDVWNTNLDTYGVPWGIRYQIEISDGNYSMLPNTTYWKDVSPNQAADEIIGFRQFMGYGTATGSSTAQFYATNNPGQVPYTPTVTTYEYISWQANDPLVHYLASDLNFQGTENHSSGPRTGINALPPANTLPRPNFYQVNDRYQPWGTNFFIADVDNNAWNLAYKDPLVRISDNWDFPTGKFPTVGWLGRVHRGTPWQTVYLKASDVLKEAQPLVSGFIPIGTNTWAQWTGNSQLTYDQYFDAANTAPVQDRLLFDLFTTAFNDNATRGTLSVNVGATNGPSLAAWSALFSGVEALSNNVSNIKIGSLAFRLQFQHPPPYFTNLVIAPAGAYNPALPLAQQPPLVQIVQAINQTRATFTNADGLAGSFEHVGDILSVPQLTEQSPFLNRNVIGQIKNGISDEMYEWLPQQTLSLMRCSDSPRYVIYCYGQTLKPAPDSVYNAGGPYFGMITNYQVVSEIATRAVVRFDSMVTNVVTFATDYSTYTNWYSMPVVTNNNAVIESFNILPPD